MFEKIVNIIFSEQTIEAKFDPIKVTPEAHKALFKKHNFDWDQKLKKKVKKRCRAHAADQGIRYGSATVEYDKKKKKLWVTYNPKKKSRNDLSWVEIGEPLDMAL